MILPLHKMTVTEKLRAMEELWADLTRNADRFESPDWHGAALKERQARVASGKTSYMEWERAKKEIKKEIRRRVA